MKKTVVELFAGVGGFRVGLNDIEEFDETGKAIEKNDWQFVWANQWEPSTKAQPAFECYCTRFGYKNHSNENIQRVDKSTIPDHTLLVGGFPCQDYSVARSLSGEQGIVGKKGVLFWDIADVLREKNPPFVLLENVDRLLKSPSKQRGRDFGIMLRTFHDYGYNVEWRVINAADYGASQRRRRVFIFAWSNKTKYMRNSKKIASFDLLQSKGLFAQRFFIEPFKKENIISTDISSKSFFDTVEMTKDFKFQFENTGSMIEGVVNTTKTVPIYEKPITLGEILQQNVSEKYYLDQDKLAKFMYLKGSKKLERIRPNGEPYNYSEGAIAFPDYLNLPSRTMLTSEGTTNRSTHIIEDIDTKNVRLITPVEAERLQHFPDNWTNTGMTEKQRYFMMGNALVTKVINELEPSLSAIIENE